MTALGRRPATQVAPLVFVAETLAPVALAPLLLGERWPTSPGLALLLVAGLALVVAGAVVLVRSPTLSGFLGPLHASSPTAPCVVTVPDGIHPDLAAPERRPTSA
jgi:hypothetical protein